MLPDQLDDLVERCARGLLGDDPAHLVRVFLVRQFHRRIQGREAIGAGRLVQHALELDLSELCLHLPRSSSNVIMLDAFDIPDLDAALLRRAQIEVRLHHRSQHLSSLCFHHPLDLVQWCVHRVFAAQRVFKLLHAMARVAERAVIGDRAGVRGGHSSR